MDEHHVVALGETPRGPALRERLLIVPSRGMSSYHEVRTWRKRGALGGDADDVAKAIPPPVLPVGLGLGLGLGLDVRKMRGCLSLHPVGWCQDQADRERPAWYV